MKKKILVILGPTTVGKTDLALGLAKKFNGELVSCDSRQVYVGLDIGSGKLPSGSWKVEVGRWKKGKGFWEMGGVKIWMYDMVSPKRQYTVFDYVKDATRVIGEIRKRGRLPIVVGGTGFYLRTLLYGLSNLAIPVDVKLRKKLQGLSIKKLQQKLQKISPIRLAKMNQSDRQNPRRLIRAIELVMSGHEGDPSSPSAPQDDSDKKSESNVLKIGLTVKRDVLYKKVDERVISRINQGMVEEAKKLHKSGLTLKRMRRLGLEYGVLADYLEGKIREIEGDRGLIKIMQRKIHGFVRHQLTWFKKEKEVFWFNIANFDYQSKIERFVSDWYNQK